MTGCIIGIDLGGTKLRIGAVQNGSLSCFDIYESKQLGESENPISKLAELIKGFCDQNNLDAHAVSIGVPASVCEDCKTVHCAPNLKDSKGRGYLDKVNLADILSSIMHVPVVISKDVNNILLYDVCHFGLEDRRTVAACYIGTGFGGAIYIDGRILLGKNGGAMDIGHIPLFHGKKICGCGKRGCAEAYVSGVELIRIRDSFFPETEVGELFLKHAPTPELTEFVHAASQPFAMLACILDPDVLIAGGGVINIPGFPRDVFEGFVKQTTSNVVSSNIRFLYSTDLPEKGVIGAAIHAEKEL